MYDTDFEILTPDGELTFWEYVDFLREVMYEEYVQILRPTSDRDEKEIANNITDSNKNTKGN